MPLELLDAEFALGAGVLLGSGFAFAFAPAFALAFAPALLLGWAFGFPFGAGFAFGSTVTAASLGVADGALEAGGLSPEPAASAPSSESSVMASSGIANWLHYGSSVHQQL